MAAVGVMSALGLPSMGVGATTGEFEGCFIPSIVCLIGSMMAG
jgi:hypothetical protein